MLFCLREACSALARNYDVLFQDEKRKHQVADTAANIIDLAAYRVRKRAAAFIPSSEPSGQAAAGAFPMALYGFWPVWVWMPFPVPAMFAVERDAL